MSWLAEELLACRGIFSIQLVSWSITSIHLGFPSAGGSEMTAQTEACKNLYKDLLHGKFDIEPDFMCLVEQRGLTHRRLMSYIYMEHPFLMFLDHTQRRSAVGRTPLDE